MRLKHGYQRRGVLLNVKCELFLLPAFYLGTLETIRLEPMP